jgi:hypothetical protein
MTNSTEIDITYAWLTSKCYGSELLQDDLTNSFATSNKQTSTYPIQ